MTKDRIDELADEVTATTVGAMESFAEHPHGTLASMVDAYRMAARTYEQSFAAEEVSCSSETRRKV